MTVNVQVNDQDSKTYLQIVSMFPEQIYLKTVGKNIPSALSQKSNFKTHTLQKTLLIE